MAFGRAVRLAAAAAIVVGAGCFDPGNGASPDDARAYYPVGLALSPSAKHLFLANSDFDLAFNAGTIEALDAESIVATARACERELLDLRAAERKAANDPNRASVLAPAEAKFNADCWGLDLARFVRASVRVGAFASDLKAITRYDVAGTEVSNGGRLLAPVRGDATLTIVDYDELPNGSITLRCTADARPDTLGTICAPGWRAGNDPTRNSRGIVLEGEPFAVAASSVWLPNQEPRASGGIAAIVHQSSGDVSLFVETAMGDAGNGPPGASLVYTLSGLPAGGTSITPLDILDSPFTPRFLVTNRTQASVFVVSYFRDQGTFDRSSLAITDIVPIPTQQAGFDSRAVVVDPPNPGENRPTRIFLTNRTPASLIVGEIDPTTRRLHFFSNIPLPIGPSRLARATVVRTDNGVTVTRTRLYASAFDAREVVSFDLDAQRFGDVIHVGRGPYSVTYDPIHRVGFLANFTESTLQVLELDPANAGAYEQVVLTLGTPADPRR